MCATFKQKDVMEVVEDVLSRYSTTALLPENSMEPLLSACTDARIHLNCVYFLRRRVPTMLSGLPFPSSRRRVNIHNDLKTRRNNKETNTENENTDAGDKEKDNHDDGSTMDTSHHNGKRKRTEDLIG